MKIPCVTQWLPSEAPPSWSPLLSSRYCCPSRHSTLPAQTELWKEVLDHLHWSLSFLGSAAWLGDKQLFPKSGFIFLNYNCQYVVNLGILPMHLYLRFVTTCIALFYRSSWMFKDKWWSLVGKSCGPLGESMPGHLCYFGGMLQPIWLTPDISCLHLYSESESILDLEFFTAHKAPSQAEKDSVLHGVSTVNQNR